MASPVPNYVALQNEFEARVNEEIEFLASQEGSVLSEFEIQSHLRELESDFQGVRERHEKIFLSKPQEASIKYLDDNLIGILRKKYHQAWGLMNSRLPKPVPTNTTAEIFNSTAALPLNNTVSEIKLSKIDLPTFSGRYEDWMAFDNMFTATVHNNANMEPIVKLQRLKRAVTGEAELLIKNIRLDGANYETARKLLSNRYQHTRRLVNSYLKKLYDFPKMKTESSRSLTEMLNSLNDCTSALEQLKLPIEDYQLIFHMCRKLPPNVLAAWEESIGATTELPLYSKFLEFLETRFRTMEMIEPAEHSSRSFHVKSSQDYPVKSYPNTTSNNNSSFKSTSKQTPSCLLCKGNHYLSKCEQFTKMSQQDRLQTIKKFNCCLNCFSPYHVVKGCSSKTNCKVCNKRHHTTLHRYTASQNTSTFVTVNQTETHQQSQVIPTTHSFHTNFKESAGTLLGTAQVRAVSPVGITLVVRALIDPCSEDSYILASTVQMLQLKKYYSPSIIGVLGDDHASESTHRVDLFFKSMDDRFSMKVSACVVDKITSNLPVIHLPKEAFGSLPSLPLADNSFNQPGSIDLLLGVSVHTKIMLGEFSRLGEHLVAENTLLGYLIRGQLPTRSGSSLVLMTHSAKLDLNTQLQKFWETEEVHHNPPIHPDDALCEQIFLSSVHQDANGFLTIKLPFKGNEHPNIGPSRYMAVKRFQSLERKLNANPILKKEYHKTINDYLDSNHLSKSTTPSSEGYFLPHHAVMKESSTTTKVRVVFDASCRSLDGTSLNDHLLTGPKLQRDIREIIFNWRQYPFSITADIAKMYRMFNIISDDHKFQKIVWRFDENEPIEDYVLKTATFGTSCAPFLAIRCLQHIADLYKEINPSASLAIKTEFYVDDFISGGFTVEETYEKQTQVRTILNNFNLSLRKWSSNDKNVISNIPDDLLELSKDLTFDETNFRKTLGIFWSQHTDSFFFSIDPPRDPTNPLTKRQILSLIARLYDPLGWVSPCTMLAKQIMQKVWQTKTGWDDIVDMSITSFFMEFLSQLPNLRTLSIPRWTKIVNNTSALTIFGFSDASDKGYSAVVYLLNPNPAWNENELILLTSKTKVADLKYQSTARLELNGALLLADLLKWTKEMYKPRDVEIRAFCDSKIVLSWLQGHPSKWKTYIANRTSQILEWMESSQWSYVDTKLNPADCASRGLLPNELLNHPLWFNGPNVKDLQYNHQFTLNDDQEKIIADAIKKNSLVLHTKRTNASVLLSYFSSHTKLLKRIETILRFINNILEKLSLNGNNLQGRLDSILSNFSCPETVIFRMLQNESYNDEIKCLQTDKELPKNSKIRSMHPFLDGNGILRVGGRLQNADLSFDQQHPIILPVKHQVVTNLILEAHEKTMHGTELLTIAYLRNRFHIPRMAEKVRKFIHDCMTCFKFAKHNQKILMGSLPRPRVNFTNPFEHTGVDYAGPLTIKAYPGRCKKYLKSYIAVFICLCTKAIHIELVSDLSSLSFLAAFKRFSARRGRCYRLYSDNGTNFVKASKILIDDIRLAEQSWRTQLEIDFKALGTYWSFIPPASPHFGGLWEAGVKSIKSHLKKTIGTSLLTFEEMTTVLTQIEAVLNSRPLCSLSTSSHEFNFLTPGHFLIGRSIIAPPEKCFSIDQRSPSHRWMHVQATYQRFVHLWKRDYLRNLQNRPKGTTTTVTFEKGNLVLLAEDDMPPTLWPMVIIDETHPGTDGVVRVVTIRTPTGKLLKRPVVKLRWLPCNFEKTN